MNAKIYYLFFVLPFLVAYPFLGEPREALKWTVGIGAGATLGSIIGTEVTFWQVKHRSFGVMDYLLNELFRKFENSMLYRDFRDFINSPEFLNFVEQLALLSKNLNRLMGAIKDAETN